MASVTLLIPHHAGRHHIKPLFESLRRQQIADFEVNTVLIDNASSDGSTKRVRNRYPEVEILELSKNRGFAPALNIAAQHFRSDWLVFLNNDVHASPDWLHSLLSEALRLEAKCVSSHLMDWDGDTTQFGGGEINLGGKGFEQDSLADEAPYEIFFPCGCGMAVQREFFLQAGGFDDDFFMIYEDVDFGWRARLMGESIWLIPEAQLYHRGHASLSAEDYARKAVFFERNSLAAVYKNLDEANLARLFPLIQQEALVRAQALDGWHAVHGLGRDGLALMDGLLAFWQRLDEWRRKRQTVQAMRTVEDRAILSRFLHEPARRWAYTAEHAQRMDAEPYADAIGDCWARLREAFDEVVA